MATLVCHYTDQATVSDFWGKSRHDQTCAQCANLPPHSASVHMWKSSNIYKVQIFEIQIEQWSIGYPKIPSVLHLPMCVLMHVPLSLTLLLNICVQCLFPCAGAAVFVCLCVCVFVCVSVCVCARACVQIMVPLIPGYHVSILPILHDNYAYLIVDETSRT
jgi:hypothetical protein